MDKSSQAVLGESSQKPSVNSWVNRSLFLATTEVVKHVESNQKYGDILGSAHSKKSISFTTNDGKSLDGPIMCDNRAVLVDRSDVSKH